MNLYKISQNEHEDYDTFDSAIVAAESEDEARKIPPTHAGDGGKWVDGGSNKAWASRYSAWASSPSAVTAELIGTAAEGTPEGVILASFNAG